MKKPARNHENSTALNTKVADLLSWYRNWKLPLKEEPVIQQISESQPSYNFFSLDRRYCYTQFSPLHQETINKIWGADIAVGRNFLDLITDADDRKKAKTNFDKVLRGEHLLINEKYGDSRLNRRFYESHYSPVKNHKGEIVGISVFVFDVSDRHFFSVMNDKNQTSEELKILSAAISQSIMSIMVTDVDGQLEFVNPMFTDLTGYSAEEATGRNPRFLRSSNKPDPKYKELWDTLLSGKTWNGVFYNKKKNGDLYTERATISPIISEQGVISHFLALKEDITLFENMTHELKGKNEQFRIVTESAPEGIIMMDDHENISFWNPAAEQILGYTNEEALGKNLHQLLVSERFHEAHQKAYLEFKKTGKGQAIGRMLELKARHKSGKEIAVELLLSAININSTWHALGYLRDITEKKQFEETIKENEEKYRIIAQNSSDGIIVFDRQHKITYMSPSYSRQLGLDEDKAHLRSDEDIQGNIHPDDREMVIRHIFNGIESKAPEISYTYRAKHQNGHYIWREDKATFSYDEQMNYVGTVVVSRDVTQRKQEMDETIRQSGLISTLLDSIPDLIFYKDTEGVYLGCNNPFTQFVGKPKHDIVGKTDYDLFDKKTADMFRHFDLEMMKWLQPSHNEEWVSYPDGTRVLLDTLKTPYKSNDGHLIGVMGISRDITEIKRADDLLVESERNYKSLYNQMEAILDHIPAMVFYKDIDNNFIRVNKFFAGAQDKSFFEGKNMADLYSDEQAEKYHQDDLEVINSGSAKLNFEEIVLGEDGIKNVITSKIPFVDIAGEVKGIIGISMDITDRKKTENELKLLTTRLALATQAGGVGVWEYNIPESKLIWDEQMFALYGIDEMDFSGVYDAWRSGLHPDDAERSDAEIQQAIRGEKEFDTEFRVVWPDGSVHHIRALARVLRDAEGHALRMIGTNWDITDRKQAEEELKKQNELQNMLTAISSKYINMPLEEIDHAINEALHTLSNFVGADRSTVFNYDWEKQTYIKKYQWFNQEIEKQVSETQNIPFERLQIWVHAHHNGEVINIPDVAALPDKSEMKNCMKSRGVKSLISLPMMDGDQCMGFVSFASVNHHHLYSAEEEMVLRLYSQMLVNVYKRVEMEQDLTLQNELYNVISGISARLIQTESSGLDPEINRSLEVLGQFNQVDRTYIFDLDPVYDLINNTFEWCAEGITPEIDNLQGIPFAFILRWKETFLRNEHIYIESVSDLPDHLSHEKEILEPQGIKSLLSVPMYYGPKIIGFIGFDSVQEKKYWSPQVITLLKVYANVLAGVIFKKKNEAALSKAKLEADTANKSKSEFLANMSHEIRTPLHSILGFSEVLLKKSEDEAQKSQLLTIFKSGQLLLTLINDILDLSKIEANKMELNLKPLNLPMMLSDVVMLFELKVKEKKLQLKLNVEQHFPENILIDQLKLKQILINLVGNAIKFTNKGLVSIDVKTTAVLDDKMDFEISITDTGIGIPAAYQQKIFEPFTQQSGQDSRLYGGTGLGLPISKSLCEMMNGSILLESEPDKGSKFTLKFKSVEVLDQAIDKQDQLTWDLNAIVFRGSKILIVDDIEPNRNLLFTFLNNYDLQLFEAQSGKEAIEMATTILPDLILMDISMPEISGNDVVKILRQNPVSRLIPIVAITAILVTEQNQGVVDLYDGFLNKPLQQKTLVGELIKHLPHELTEVGDSGKQVITLNRGQQETIPEEIKVEFNKVFSYDICELTELMVMEEISDFIEKALKFSTQHKLLTLEQMARELRHHVLDFNLNSIEKGICEIKQMFKL